MKFVNHYVRRTATPCDRHKRVVAYRHTPYVSAKTKREIFLIEEKETPVVQKEIHTAAKLSDVPENNIAHMQAVQDTVKEEVKLTRKQKKEFCRNAEITALINRKKYKLTDIFFRPYSCMVNEAQEEISASFLSSLLRLVMKWLVVSVFLGISFQEAVNAKGLRFLSLNFTGTASIVFGLTILFILCEVLSYVLAWIVCMIKRKGISLTRIFAVGSMDCVFMVTGFIITGFVCRKNPVYGMLLMVMFFVMDMYLRHNAFGRCTECSKELQACLFTVSVVLEAYCFIQLFGLTMTKMIELFALLIQ